FKNNFQKYPKSDPYHLMSKEYHEERLNEAKVVKACLAEYYEMWDIDAKETLPPFKDFFDKIQYSFENLHEFAVDLICLALEELRICINTDIEKQDNLSVTGFHELYPGLEKLDAREYTADLRVREFECRNEGFLKEHFKCLYPATKSRKGDLDECAKKLSVALQSGEEMCQAMDEYISCARGIIVSECGADVSSFVCNIIETAMKFNYPSCSRAFQTCV
ncbi:hypothetical protein PFISCL1PPCAC_17603, partial [Pristionchus fissidentatus]